jgi:hypothetical protein
VLDAVKALNEQQLGVVGDPEIATRISQYEMAYRMQTSVPELMDITQENKATLDMYGAHCRARRPLPTTACSPAASSSVACAWCSSLIPTGTITAASNNDSPRKRRTWIGRWPRSCAI